VSFSRDAWRPDDGLRPAAYHQTLQAAANAESMPLMLLREIRELDELIFAARA
jgi:hypothetical protein